MIYRADCSIYEANNKGTDRPAQQLISLCIHACAIYMYYNLTVIDLQFKIEKKTNNFFCALTNEKRYLLLL